MNGSSEKYKLVLTPIQYTPESMAMALQVAETQRRLAASLIEEDRLRREILFLHQAELLRLEKANREAAARQMAEFETVSHQLVGLRISCDDEVAKINGVKK